MLNYETFGLNHKHKPIMIVHGLFGSGKNWRTISKALANHGRFVIVVDMRNHGASFWSDDHSYELMAADLIQVADIFGGCVDIIGHSMGGKAAMSLTLMSSEYVSKLIVVDISPVRYLHTQLKNLQAMAELDLKGIKSRKDAENKLGKAISNLSERQFLLQNLNFKDVSNLKWNINLESLKQNLSNIMDFPDFNQFNSQPTLFIKGALSHYILEEHLAVIETFFPNYELITVQGAGHWVHVEKKEEFIDSILRFLC